MATQTGSIDLTASNSVKLMAEAGFESVEENYYTKAELDVTVQGINTEVSKKVNGTEIISTINQSAESVSINASKVNLQGAVTISDLASDAQNATLNSNISVGGRNIASDIKLWRNRTSSGYAAQGITITKIDNGLYKAVGTTTQAGDIWWMVHSAENPLSSDSGQYTMSITIEKGTWPSANFYLQIAEYGSSWHANIRTANGETSKTFTCASGYHPRHLGFYSGASGISIDIEFRIKLEKGNKATDWTPAPEDTEAYADESAYLSAKPNLTPFFEHDLKDVYNATTNPTGYWNGGGGDWISGSSTFATVMENGWAHINRTNSGTSTMNTYIRPFANGRTLDDGDYTFLVEFRNVESMPTTSTMYTQQNTDAQIWGNHSYGGFTINNADIAAGNQSYQAYYKPVQLLGVSQHGTTGEKLVHINWQIPAGGTVTCDLRLSIYEGNYTGPWKSYVDSELTARMKTAEAGISNAAKTATSYVTEITGQNGIMVHPSTDQTTGVKITSDVDILRNGHNVINVGTQGDTSGNTDAGVTIYDGTANENVVATFAGDGIGLAGDAFHLTSTKTTTSGGSENIVSNIEMKSTNSSYGVRSNIYSDTSISNQAQGLGGYMGLSLAVGDSTFDNIYANPTIYMYATSSSSALTAAADEVDLIAAQGQIRVETNECVLRFSNGGSNTWSTAAGTVIWSSSGWQMAANVTATLSRNVSTCPSGIVLHWQAYASNATQDYDHIYTFIPKQHVAVSNGKGVVCQLANGGFGFVGTKYVYVSDSGITGHSTNQATGTSNGITYNNGHWVLTQVIAV